MVHLMKAWALWTTPLIVVSANLVLAAYPQAYLGQQAAQGPEYHKFEAIRRVAVIGAGPNGLQHAANLIEHGFEVRLFERAPAPGGNWFYTPEVPLPAQFPDPPLSRAAYVSDAPQTLPGFRIFEEGQDGLTINERWREHWGPSPVWHNLHSNSAPFFTSLPDIKYPSGADWSLSHHDIRRHVRQYASQKDLNANDDAETNVTSYSTRVELVRKTADGKKWALTLRKLERLSYPNRLRVDWWMEEFDAVVVATSKFDAPHVPMIPGIEGWGKRFKDQLYHSQRYRHPERLAGKNVLIIGGSISSAEIARDLSPHVAGLAISMRPQDPPRFLRRVSLRRLPANITMLPEIKLFSQVNVSTRGVRDAIMTLINGTVLTDFDEIILATGYKRSNPFLVDFHNCTILRDDEPDVKVAPILTDGTHLRSLHWTGHYIADPTLAFATGRPWTLGPYQALAVAKSWSGKARLPNIPTMWKMYPGARKGLDVELPAAFDHESYRRLIVTYLNNESLEFGGRLVDSLPMEEREQIKYYVKNVEPLFAAEVDFTQYENTPFSEWGTRAGTPNFSGEGQEYYGFEETW